MFEACHPYLTTPILAAHVAKPRGVHLQCRDSGATAQLSLLDSKERGLGDHARRWADDGMNVLIRDPAALRRFANCHKAAGESLIVSDGSEYLFFWDPDTLSEIRRVRVVDSSGRGVTLLNELEYVHGWVVANLCEASTGSACKNYNPL